MKTALSALLVPQVFGLTSAEGAHLALTSSHRCHLAEGREFAFHDLPILAILYGLAGCPSNYFHVHEILQNFKSSGHKMFSL